MQMLAWQAELSRIRAEYQRRAREVAADFYSPGRPANLFRRHGQERALLAALAWAGALPLTSRRVLDLGCGRGQWLTSLLTLGATPGLVAGIDLDPHAIAVARSLVPDADLRAGDASRLPWPDATFDVVLQSTVFTSVLFAEMRVAIAVEMRRVCRPGGCIIWYDFCYDNPRNPHVKGLQISDVQRLFPGGQMRFWRTTLAPPLARRLVPVSWGLAAVLESLSVLNTHVMAAYLPARPLGGRS